MAEKWGCSRRQARRVVTEAHKEWMDVAFGDENVDQCDLLFQCIARLERMAWKAEEAGNGLLRRSAKPLAVIKNMRAAYSNYC